MIKRFDKDYFKSLKTSEEKEEYTGRTDIISGI